MKLIFITLILLLLNFSAYTETKVFKIAFIDLHNDIRYSEWGRHPVDIRSSNSIQARAVDGAKLGIIDSEKYKRITKTKITLKHFRFKNEKVFFANSHNFISFL